MIDKGPAPVITPQSFEKSLIVSGATLFLLGLL